MFPDLYNPFALPSIMRSWAWLDPTIADMGPYLRRRGLVFASGKPLEPMEQLAELGRPELPPVPDFTVPPKSMFGMPPRRRGGPIMQEIGGSPTARFGTENSGRAIYIGLESGTPADHLIEDNLVEWCGWADAQRGWEAAASSTAPRTCCSGAT